MGYIIAFIIGALFGIFGMGLVAASGRYNDREEAYEQGKIDALNYKER